MPRNQKKVSASGSILLFIILLNAIVLKTAFTGSQAISRLLFITLPLLALAIYNIKQTKYSILRDYPVIGYLFYWPKPKDPKEPNGRIPGPKKDREDISYLN